MFWTKIKTALGATAILGVLGVGTALLYPSLAPTAQAQAQGEGDVLKSQPVDTVPTWRLRTTLDVGDETKALSISPDGKMLATVGGDKTARVRLWDVTTGKELADLPARWQTIRSVAFSPDGKNLVTGGHQPDPENRNGALISVWNLESQNIVSLVDAQAPLVFVQTGKDRVLALNNAGMLRLIDTTGKEETRKLKVTLASTIQAAAVSPDQKILAVAPSVAGQPSDKEIDLILLDIDSGKVIRRLTGLPVGRIVIAFSPDGQRLAVSTGLKSEAWRLWDVTTGKAILNVDSNQDTIRSLAFSPDGKVLATAGDDKTVRLWDTATGKQLSTLRGHNGIVIVVIFAASGRQLVTAGADGTVRLWDLAATGKAATPESGVGVRLTALVGALLKSKMSDDQMIEALCLATLARMPAETEAQLMRKHLVNTKDRREALLDIVWALVNSQEFHSNVEELNKQDPRRGKK